MLCRSAAFAFFLGFFLVFLPACLQSTARAPENFEASRKKVIDLQLREDFDSAEPRAGKILYEIEPKGVRPLPGNIAASITINSLRLNGLETPPPGDTTLLVLDLITWEDGIEVLSSVDIKAGELTLKSEQGWTLAIPSRQLQLSRPTTSSVSRAALRLRLGDEQFTASQAGRLRFSLSHASISQDSALRTYGDAGRISQLKVMSFNIKAGRQEGSSQNLDKIAAFITEENVDVVFLQEVDQSVERTGKVDQLEYLKARTGMFGFFTKSIDLEGGAYGIAMLSRHPFLSEAGLSLEVPYNKGWYEKRSLQIATIRVGEHNLAIANTHLHASAKYNRREVDLLLRHLSDAIPETMPLVLGGDFNTADDSEVYLKISQTLNDALHQLDPSVFAPRLDYIFSRKLSVHFFQETRVDFSDHNPIVSSFSF